MSNCSSADFVVLTGGTGGEIIHYIMSKAYLSCNPNANMHA